MFEEVLGVLDWLFIYTIPVPALGACLGTESLAQACGSQNQLVGSLCCLLGISEVHLKALQLLTSSALAVPRSEAAHLCALPPPGCIHFLPRKHFRPPNVSFIKLYSQLIRACQFI